MSHYIEPTSQGAGQPGHLPGAPRRLRHIASQVQGGLQSFPSDTNVYTHEVFPYISALSMTYIISVRLVVVLGVLPQGHTQ